MCSVVTRNSGNITVMSEEALRYERRKNRNW